MKIGFDYWQVISHYPEHIGYLMLASGSTMPNDEVHVISAIGSKRRHTIKHDVYKSLNDAGWGTPTWCVPPENIHEVVFNNSKESPALKLAKCQELGIEIFYDDRQDVVDLLNQNRILAFLVPRKKLNLNDLQAERK